MQAMEKIVELIKPQLAFHGITLTKEVASVTLDPAEAPYLMGTTFCLINQSVSALQLKVGPRTLMLHVRRTPEGELSVEVVDNARPVPHNFRDEWLRLLSPIARLVPFGVRVTYSSSAEAGNRAHVLLPLESARGHGLSRRHALVIDDSQTSLNVMRKLLEARGMTVDTVDNGYKGLLWLRQRSYDLVLLDLNMPGIDGPFLYTAISQELPHMVDRLLVVSGTLEDHRDFLEKNRIVALPKPPVAEALYAAMEQILETVERTKDWRSSRHSGRALVLVQDEGFLRLVDELLLEWGYDIEWVNTWYKGLYKLTTSRFDLVFLDLEIPGIHDPTMMKTVMREIQKDAQRFVVLRSAGASGDGLDRVEQVTLLEKPIERTRFHRTLAMKIATLQGP